MEQETHPNRNKKVKTGKLKISNYLNEFLLKTVKHVEDIITMFHLVIN